MNNSCPSSIPTPASPKIQRQDSSASSNPRTRNVRNLSIAPSPVTATPSSSSYASLSESARILSTNPPTPRLGATPLQSIPSSRPGTPSLRPRTPGLGYAPLTPNAGSAVFSPNTPLYSPNALPSPNPVPTKASKLKSHITSFLPLSKHTYFHAKIEIEQLSSVPFVGGQFGVRWRFKNVVRHTAEKLQEGAVNDEEQGLLGRVAAKAKAVASSGKDKGKAREQYGSEVGEFGTVPPTQYHPPHQGSTSTNASTDSATSESSSFTTSTGWSSTSMSSVASNSTGATKMPSGSSTPSTNLSRNFYSPYASTGSSTSPSSQEAQYGPSQYLFITPPQDGPTSPSPGSNSSGAVDSNPSLLFSPNTQSFSSNAAFSPMSPNYNPLSPQGPMSQGTPHAVTSPLPGGAQGQIGHLSAARGMTQYLPLKSHSVTFNFPLEAIVKMDVTRSVNQVQHQQTVKPNLQPSPLKLVVMQRVDPEDPSSVAQNPRLGAVFINLAEYVGKGKVERRFLLKESRVNATLKLNIEVTYVSGYQGYVAPPLPKAEILGGIEGFLKEHDNLLSKKKAMTLGTGLNGKEFEVDLLSRGFLEREKDRIGEVMGADPYALPSESETESEYGGPPVPGRPRAPERRMTEEVLGRKRWKEDLRAKRREERSKKLMLNLSESEGDDSNFESADEGPPLDAQEEKVDTRAALSDQIAESVAPNAQRSQIRVAAFDVQRLPLSYGPKTTESLIEALFNPGPTTEQTDDDPFVIYVSPTEIREREALEAEYRREMELVKMQQAQYQEQGVQRVGTMDSSTTSTSTTSGSGSGGSPVAPLTSMKSPGEDTIVGVRMGDDVGDEPDVLSPATITAASPNRPAQHFTGLGIALENVQAPGAPDRDATIGKGGSGGTAGVGSFLHNYYRSKKDKVKEKKAGAKSKERGEVNNVFGGTYYDQEPQEMPYGQLGHEQQLPAASGHQRTATGGTMTTMSSNASSSSLSSLGLNGSAHGHGTAAAPAPGLQHSPGPPAPLPLPGAPARLRQQPDLSVPAGRMDKMGVVKGVTPSIGDQAGDESGLGSKLKGWWKGSQR
ncbi:hypothetical protein DFP72DRAFT_823549 [Ephemerocybe angulata]|uniref:C2 NT-type domain-containing protein n=1 Tax=Ephemerocybe angulata TaxID=980116 RepID=A0A8H6HFB7_9AGAR|nr:hypothetical protein DFP72DRAFT_823549 [Tulosesus angulatus]